MLQQQLAKLMQQAPEMRNDFLTPPSMTGQIGSQATTFHGDPGGLVQVGNYNPAQMGRMGEAANLGWDQMKKLFEPQPQQQGYKPFDFGPIADLARRNFNQTTIPSIAERFSSLGTGGSQRSSAFPRLLKGAGEDLDAQLAAMQEQFGLQERGLGLQERGQNSDIASLLMRMGQHPMFENMLRPSSESGGMTFLKWLGNSTKDAAQAAGKYASMA